MMLSGLSLELLSKALLIERNPKLVDQGNLTDWPGGGHDLLSLMRQTGITMDAVGIYLVERLGESVVWVGRYSIPKKAENMAPRRTPHGELAAPGDFHPDPDKERIDAIWERLRGHNLA